MILFFSGTGNSRHIARLAAQRLQDDVVDISTYTRTQTGAQLQSAKPYVLVVPIYCSYIPMAVHRFIQDSTFAGNDSVYFLITCGFTYAKRGANARLFDLLQAKSLRFCGSAAIIMPENFITVYRAPFPALSRRIVAHAEHRLPRLLARIEQGRLLQTAHARSLLSHTLNPRFCASLSDEPFHVTDACVGCGLCERVCPLANIILQEGHPVWHGNCTQCMACISRCPHTAIQYGRKTQRKRRHYLP